MAAATATAAAAAAAVSLAPVAQARAAAPVCGPGTFSCHVTPASLRQLRVASSSRRWAAVRIPGAARSQVAVAAEIDEKVVEGWNKEARGSRLKHLEEQALATLKIVLESFKSPTFPCALIAGDVVILDLLHKLDALKSGKVKVVFIDTFHLFPETYQFLADCEKRYGFKAKVFHAAGLSSREEYVEKYGSDLFITDVDEYDRICKVEPFGRALQDLKVDAMINGRRRDHGAERAHLEMFEAGKMVKVQPLAYWEFRDCFAYLEQEQVPAHPLHEDGFPSIGDYQSTIPVPREKWFEYGGERSGRFQGLKNKDGSEKTECGIHVGDAREVAKV